MWEGENESSFLGASTLPLPSLLHLTLSFSLSSHFSSTPRGLEAKFLLKSLSLFSLSSPRFFYRAPSRTPKEQGTNGRKRGEERNRGRKDEAQGGIRGPSISSDPVEGKIKKGNHEEGREYPRIGPSAFSHGFESKRDVTARGYHVSSVLRKM